MHLVPSPTDQEPQVSLALEGAARATYRVLRFLLRLSTNYLGHYTADDARLCGRLIAIDMHSIIQVPTQRTVSHW